MCKVLLKSIPEVILCGTNPVTPTGCDSSGKKQTVPSPWDLRTMDLQKKVSGFRGRSITVSHAPMVLPTSLGTWKPSLGWGSYILCAGPTSLLPSERTSLPCVSAGFLLCSLLQQSLGSRVWLPLRPSFLVVSTFAQTKCDIVKF